MNIIINELWRQIFLSIYEKYFKDEKTAKKSLVSFALLIIGAKILNNFLDRK